MKSQKKPNKNKSNTLEDVVKQIFSSENIYDIQLAKLK